MDREQLIDWIATEVERDGRLLYLLRHGLLTSLETFSQEQLEGIYETLAEMSP